MVESAQKEVE